MKLQGKLTTDNGTSAEKEAFLGSSLAVARKSSVRRREGEESAKQKLMASTPVHYSKASEETRETPQVNSIKSRMKASVPNQSGNQGSGTSEMKTHRGPINLSSVTMRDPRAVFNELMTVLEDLEVRFKSEGGFVVECESKKSRFTIEMQNVERLKNVFVIKFFRKGSECEHYLEVCERIFGKLNL